MSRDVQPARHKNRRLYFFSFIPLEESMKKTVISLAIASSVSALAPAPAAAQSATGTLRAGAARIEITPPASPAYPAMNEYDHEKLYLRVIVIDNGKTKMALIGADLGGINEEVWAEASKRVGETLGIPPQNVVLSSTHTHSDWPANATTAPGQPRYGSDFVSNVAVDAVKKAVSALQPAKVGYSTGEAYLNVNRDAINPRTHLWTQAANFNAYSDKTVSVLSVIKPSGEPIATYVNYAMHPVNGYLSGFVSGDFAAATSRYIERNFSDDVVAIFTQGASGDQNPRWLRTGTNTLASKTGVPISGYEMSREDVEAPLRNKQVVDGPLDPKRAHQLADYMQALGVILGEEVIRVMSHTDGWMASPEIWAAQTTLTCPGRTRFDKVREGAAGQYEDGKDVDIRLGAVGIGDIALSTVNAEIYSRIGQRAKQMSPLSKTVLITLANGRANSGYIPDDQSFEHQTFQVLGSRLKPGCAEEGIAKGIAGMVSDHIERKRTN
ncbi:hypothetical protein FY150_21190 [Agrobacterium tumefaciens]|nr:hypothetical protein FY150_21190 [Agrobacterium tumefaciens]